MKQSIFKRITSIALFALISVGLTLPSAVNRYEQQSASRFTTSVQLAPQLERKIFASQTFSETYLSQFVGEARAAIGMATTLRSARSQAIVDTVGTGAKIAIFSGTRPATCGTATTELYRGTISGAFGTVTSGVLTMTMPPDTAASATGTASWARIFKLDGTTCMMDMTAGTSGTTMILNSTILTSGVNVSITSGSITEGNP